MRQILEFISGSQIIWRIPIQDTLDEVAQVVSVPGVIFLTLFQKFGPRAIGFKIY